MDDSGHTVTVPVRYRDVDDMGWVHNSVYFSYVEEGRMAYLEDVVGIAPEDVRAALASQDIEYRAPVTLGDDVVVETTVVALGETSLTFAFELRVDADVVATGEVVHVVFDDDGEGPMAIPERWRDRIRAHEDATLA